ncbi:hypothetical protein Pla110_13860 [Polystyrenella longa]|uniref:Uncharacterized protein n=1 Tax=Polystyrenella longa TaxID=2528007 RepID=A0A518CKB7_9PLAN|nr:hypothetical protein Pla110_13860 [Polystyrenella longa]
MSVKGFRARYDLRLTFGFLVAFGCRRKLSEWFESDRSKLNALN